MSEPRRSTRARAREDAIPPPSETPKETPTKGAKASLKRKRPSIAVKALTPSTTAADGTPLPPKQMLPLRLVDGAPLPTLAEPQPLDLPANEWLSIQQSGVLATSFERSRAVWISGSNFRTFHTFFQKPRRLAERTDEDKAKIQRQKELERNFPQIGLHVDMEKAKDEKNDRAAIDSELVEKYKPRLVVEPHTLPIRLFAPREVVKSAPKKMTAPATYGTWPNHNQHIQPNQYPQYNHGQPVYQQPKPRPPPPKPVQVAPPPPPPPTATPAPDPVIHMLAARAGTDPELKAVMKIVAAGQASKEQLEFFQTHINELTEILAKQKAETAKTSSVKAPPPPRQLLPPPAPKQPTPSKQPPPPPTPKQVVAHPQPRPVQPGQPVRQPLPYQQHQQMLPNPYSPAPPQQQQHMQYVPPMQQSRPYQNNYKQPPVYHQPQQMTSYHAPLKVNTYRPLVLEFEEGNGDKFYFPSYSFMELLPDGKGVKLSFLITKMKPQPKPDLVAKPQAPPASKAAPSSAPGMMPSGAPTNLSNPNTTTTAAPPALAILAPAPATATATATTTVRAAESTLAPATGMTPIPATGSTPAPVPLQPAAPAPVTPFVPPLRIEDFDEKNDIADIDFYQPVTALLLSEDPTILEALKRAVRPPEVVDKYMNEVFDKCKRADETYLAFRLPRDGNEPAEKRAKSTEAPPSVATPAHDTSSWMVTATDRKRAGRPKKSIGSGQ